MPKRRSKIHLDEFEVKRKNPIELGDDSNLASDFKPIKIGGDPTIINLSKTELDINGTLKVNGDDVQTGSDAGATELNELSDVTYSSGDLTIDSLDKIVTSGNLIIDTEGDIELNANGGNVFFKDDAATLVDVNNSNTKFHNPSDSGDYCTITVGNRGETAIATEDSTDSDAGHLTLRAEGSVYLDPDTGITSLQDSTLYVQEQANANADNAGYGQVWVKNSTPNELCFTDDAGTDLVGVGKYQYETKFVGFYGSSVAYAYLPITGYIIEKTSTSSNNEYISFVAPMNGTIEKYAARTEISQSGEHSFRVLESADGTEVPGTIVYRKDYTPADYADDTYFEFDKSSPSVGSDPPALTKGRIYAIYVKFPSNPLDTNVTLVFKWDLTSL